MFEQIVMAMSGFLDEYPIIMKILGPVLGGIGGAVWFQFKEWRKARREARQRAEGFWYDRVTIAVYQQLADGNWFKRSLGGLNFETLFKSAKNAEAIVHEIGPHGMRADSSFFQHVRDMLFQASSERMLWLGARGNFAMVLRRNDRVNDPRGNTEVVLVPMELWETLKEATEAPPVVVGEVHMQAMLDYVLGGYAPMWFVATEIGSKEEFMRGLAMTQQANAPA